MAKGRLKSRMPVIILELTPREALCIRNMSQNPLADKAYAAELKEIFLALPAFDTLDDYIQMGEADDNSE